MRLVNERILWMFFHLHFSSQLQVTKGTQSVKWNGCCIMIHVTSHLSRVKKYVIISEFFLVFSLLLLRGNKRPTRCNRWFFIAKIYCLRNMFRALLCPSSGAQEYYTDGCCLSLIYLNKMPTTCNRGFLLQKFVCSTCFGHYYAYHQELKSIIQMVAACR